MENKLKIGVIVTVAFVAGVVGALSFSNFESQEEMIAPQTNPKNQDIGIGAYVTVQAYHGDGTLYQKWEGHNTLNNIAQNFLVGCISGLDTTPTFGFSCTDFYDVLMIRLQNQSNSVFEPSWTALTTRTPVEAGTPEGCIFDSGLPERCTGWSVKATWDFAGLTCDPLVNCYNASNAITGINSTGVPFNTVNFDDIPVGPDDRLVVQMNFSIPT